MRINGGDDDKHSVLYGTLWRGVDEAGVDDGAEQAATQQAVVSAHHRLRRRHYAARSTLPSRTDQVHLPKVRLINVSVYRPLSAFKT